MLLERAMHPQFLSNTFLVADGEGGPGFFVDAGGPVEPLIEAAEPAGLWKLVSRVFVENAPSRRLLADLGFREVGVYRRHGLLDGRWRDVVIVERLLPAGRRLERSGRGRSIW